MPPTRCWWCNSAIGNLIRENKTFRITSAIQTGAKQGMMLLDDSLFQLWKEQKCTKEDVMAKAAAPDELAARIANAERGLFEERGRQPARARRQRQGRSLIPATGYRRRPSGFRDSAQAQLTRTRTRQRTSE